MKVEVDQSGKIEDTSKLTVLAFSNDKTGAIILSAKDKRRLQEKFREVGAPRLFVDYVFSSLLILLLKSLKSTKVVVDLEYPGHTEINESLVKLKVDVDIEWRSIGKSSKAHDIAYKVYCGKLKIGKRVKAEQIWRLSKKITGGYLKTGLSPANRYSAPVNKKMLAKK